MADDFRFSAGFSEIDVKNHEYRRLCFWSPFVTFVTIVLFIYALKVDSSAAVYFCVAGIGRLVLGITKAYYRKVYKSSK